MKAFQRCDVLVLMPPPVTLRFPNSLNSTVSTTSVCLPPNAQSNGRLVGCLSILTTHSACSVAHINFFASGVILAAGKPLPPNVLHQIHRAAPKNPKDLLARCQRPPRRLRGFFGDCDCSGEDVPGKTSIIMARTMKKRRDRN